MDQCPPVLIASLSAGRVATEAPLSAPESGLPLLLVFTDKSLVEVKKWGLRPCLRHSGRMKFFGGALENAVRLAKGKGSEVLMFIFMALPAEVLLAFKTKQDPREFE